MYFSCLEFPARVAVLAADAKSRSVCASVQTALAADVDTRHHLAQESRNQVGCWCSLPGGVFQAVMKPGAGGLPNNVTQ